jgi:uncharacterized protein YukE
MAQTIASPAEQRRFASELAELTNQIRGTEAGLKEALRELGSVWADEHYQRFTQAHGEMARRLGAFYRASARFQDYLQRKSSAGQQYLDRGR